MSLGARWTGPTVRASDALLLLPSVEDGVRLETTDQDWALTLDRWLVHKGTTSAPDGDRRRRTVLLSAPQGDAAPDRVVKVCRTSEAGRSKHEQAVLRRLSTRGWDPLLPRPLDTGKTGAMT